MGNPSPAPLRNLSPDARHSLALPGIRWEPLGFDGITTHLGLEGKTVFAGVGVCPSDRGFLAACVAQGAL